MSIRCEHSDYSPWRVSSVLVVCPISIAGLHLLRSTRHELGVNKIEDHGAYRQKACILVHLLLKIYWSLGLGTHGIGALAKALMTESVS